MKQKRSDTDYFKTQRDGKASDYPVLFCSAEQHVFYLKHKKDFLKMF